MKDCIETKRAAVNPEGHARIMINRKSYSLARIAYAIFSGKDPNTLGHILHSCDNPRCINPHHLREGSHADNMADKVKRGRARNGPHMSAQSSALALELRRDGVSIKRIAEMLYVSERALSRHFRKHGLTKKRKVA